MSKPVAKRPRRAASPRASAPLPRPTAPREVAADAGFKLQDTEIERALVTGEHAPALEAYFGDALYDEVRRLALTAQSRGTRGGPRVLVLPGISGSKLGIPGRLLDDVIWFDPVDVSLGKLDRLTLGGARKDDIRPLGVILFAYLKLKLTLQVAGYDADFYAFDWRQDVATLGAELARKIGGERGEVSIVAHSMGGLVARAAIQRGARVKRFVMLGTPNFGSFAVPQALRGTLSLVRALAALDLRHSPEDLAANVFGTFGGLYQMLPWREKWRGIDLFDASAWPAGGPRPRPELLELARDLPRRLAPPGDGFSLVAGVNRETVVDMKLEQGEIVYGTSLAGDGTVPLDLARLSGVDTYYVDEEHGALPNNSAVGRAVVDLLRGGTTRELPTTWGAPARGAVRFIAESTQRRPPLEGRRGSQIGLRERREMLAEFVSPRTSRAGTAAAPGPGAASDPRLDHVVVGRRRQRRLDLTLALGSITDVDARAYVLGVYRDVVPTGPAMEIDRRLDGAVTEFTARRMLSGAVGQTFVMPVGRSTLRADMILFAGLGTFDGFTSDVQQLVAENIVRVFARTRVEEFATLLFGAGSGRSIDESLSNMAAGFLRGLTETDGQQRFRRIILCERDPARYAELKQSLYRLAGTPLFEDVEITITEEAPPATVAADEGAAPERGVASRDPIYLMVRQTPRAADAERRKGGRAPRVSGDVVVEAALLGADGKAAVFNEAVTVAKGDLDAALDRLKSPGPGFAGLADYGEGLGELIVPPGIRKLLATMKDRHLVLVHDGPSSRIPWETLHLRDEEDALYSPALGAGITRRYMAGNLSIAKWLEERREDATLDVLLVYNPTQDLPGADEEGKRLHEAIGKEPSVRVHTLAGREATRARLLDELRRGAYDVVHYAGHAFFNAEAPEKSGIICASGEYLTGADLATLGSLPSLIVFNACEAARMRGGPLGRAEQHLSVKSFLTRTTSFAEAFLRGGAANYIGTYWPVNDRAASLFASTLYGALLGGATIGSALLVARRAMRDEHLVDWADYIHYGSPDFAVKRRSGAASGAAGHALDAEARPVTAVSAPAPRAKRSRRKAELGRKRGGPRGAR